MERDDRDAGGPKMWQDVARRIATFRPGVVTVRDGDGMPISVRQSAMAYDPATGRMPVVLTHDASSGPAMLLCHAHNERLWKLRAINIKGVVERDGDGEWAFITTDFTPPSSIEFVRGMRRAGTGYLERRGLARPIVVWPSVKRLWAEVRP